MTSTPVALLERTFCFKSQLTLHIHYVIPHFLIQFVLFLPYWEGVPSLAALEIHKLTVFIYILCRILNISSASSRNNIVCYHLTDFVLSAPLFLHLQASRISCSTSKPTLFREVLQLTISTAFMYVQEFVFIP